MWLDLYGLQGTTRYGLDTIGNARAKLLADERAIRYLYDSDLFLAAPTEQRIYTEADLAAYTGTPRSGANSKSLCNFMATTMMIQI